MAKKRNTFTIEEINRLRQLFMEKDMAGSDEKKPIRDKMRDMGFYISDFRNSMDSADFEQLLTNDIKKGLAPWIDERSEILILGSLPVMSLSKDKLITKISPIVFGN